MSAHWIYPHVTLHAPLCCVLPAYSAGLSPFRQRAAKNMFKNYIFNGYRRLSGELVYWAIPFALGTSSVRHVFPPPLPLLPPALG